MKKNRMWELDFLRGLSILLVVWDHAMYDFARVFTQWKTGGVAFLSDLSNFGYSYITGDLRFLWRPAFLFIFFCTSGLCTAFSRNNFIRGVKLLTVAAGVSLVTFIIDALFDADTFAMFGVLHCLAVIILSYSLVDIIIRGITKLVAVISKKPYSHLIERLLRIGICLALGVIFCVINAKYNVSILDMTASYATIESDSKIIGMFFANDLWWTADYFPLFPFIAFFYFGAGLAGIFYDKKKSLFAPLDGVWNVPFTFAGKYSLIVYLGGQVVVVLIGIILNFAFFCTAF